MFVFDGVEDEKDLLESMYGFQVAKSAAEIPAALSTTLISAPF